MGISINIAMQLARIAPHVADCKKGIMLGRQKMHFGPANWTPRLIKGLGAMGMEVTEEDLFQEDGFCETYLETIGWPKLKSLDFSDIEGAEYVHDLAQPVPKKLKNKFDLIYDGGTTEHVFDFAQALRNVDAMLKDDGVFVSCVGGDGWFGHGFYQVGPDVPWRFWHHSMGYEVLGCWVFTRRGTAEPLELPDPTLSPRGGEQWFDRPQFIFYAVKKKPREGPPAPVVQCHYVNY